MTIWCGSNRFVLLWTVTAGLLASGKGEFRA